LQLNLAALKQASSNRRPADAWDEIDRTIAALHNEIRAIAILNREPAMLAAPLPDALRQMASSFGALAGMQVMVEILDPKFAIPREVEAGLYRIAQEALANARRHGQADRAVIRLSATRCNLRMSIRDYGRGFAEGAAFGQGLTNIRDRLKLFGGSLRITHLIDGTLLAISTPVEAPEALRENPDGPGPDSFSTCAGGLQ
jgi:signal transduction histidine kinase